MTDDFEAKYKQQADRAHDLANQCQVLMNEKYLLEKSKAELLETLEAIVDLWGVGCSPRQFVRNLRPFIDDSRAAIAKTTGQS